MMMRRVSMVVVALALSACDGGTMSARQVCETTVDAACDRIFQCYSLEERLDRDLPVTEEECRIRLENELACDQVFESDLCPAGQAFDQERFEACIAAVPQASCSEDAADLVPGGCTVCVGSGGDDDSNGDDPVTPPPPPTMLGNAIVAWNVRDSYGATECYAVGGVTVAVRSIAGDGTDYWDLYDCSDYSGWIELPYGTYRFEFQLWDDYDRVITTAPALNGAVASELNQIGETSFWVY